MLSIHAANDAPGSGIGEPAMNAPLLRVGDLSVAFRTGNIARPAVENVSFDVHENEVLAIVGESGSGKSVMSMAIMRLINASIADVSGSAVFEGRDLLKLAEREVEALRGNRLSMIFQEPMTSLNPSLTIGEQIVEVLVRHRRISHGEAHREVVRLLDLVKIPSAAARFRAYPHDLSGGMRQRVMIAMALVCRPRLLIADEPTTALDVTIQSEILDLIRTLQEEYRMAVLFITHDMGVVAEISDRTLVMLNGSCVETGSTADLFSAPKAPYTKRLLYAVPRLGSLQETEVPARFPSVELATGEVVEGRELAVAPAYDRPPLLQVSNLVKSFRLRRGLLGRSGQEVRAVDGVSFDVFAGETLAIVGESGCGKSTLGRCLVQLLRPDQGTISFSGAVLSERPRGKLQIVFQDPFSSLNPYRSAGWSVSEPMRIEGGLSAAEMSGRTKELFRQVKLAPEMMTRLPNEFSGGQRQRLCIARALASDPEIIVADEAVAALDVSVKAEIMNLMMDLQEARRVSFVFISHDIAAVERISHRIAVMYQGEIVELGSRKAVLSEPAHPYTRRLLSAVPVPDPKARRLRVADNPSRVLKSTSGDEPRRYVEVAKGHFVLTR